MIDVIEKIDLEIPGELINRNSNDITYEPIVGKTIIGLCGYARSGKDTLGRIMVERLGFKRISFGDTLKKDLDEYMRMQVLEDLINKNIELSFNDINFLNPKNISTKELLRPYMIWFGEKMKQINGVHHWTNRALREVSEADKKVVITDVRRENELEIFRFNREYHRRLRENRRFSNVPTGPIDEAIDEYSYDSLLLHINQYGLKDSDMLTVKTIIKAHEEWLFNDIIYIDSRIPDKDNYRELHIKAQIKKLAQKFPEYFI
jgi:hypothetical protein